MTRYRPPQREWIVKTLQLTTGRWLEEFTVKAVSERGARIAANRRSWVHSAYYARYINPKD
jgi:hypothetical protein